MPFEEIEGRIERTERRWRYVSLVLPRVLARWLVAIEWARSERAARQETQEAFASAIEDLSGVCDRLSDDVERIQARDFDDPPAEFRKVTVRYDTATDLLDGLSELDRQYLRETELEELSTYEDQLATTEDWIEAYRRVGRDLDTVEREHAALGEALEPYREYQTYMTSSEQAALAEQIEGIERRLQRAFDSIRVNRMAETYLDGLTDIEREIHDRRSFVDGYNERFIEREQDRHDALFTDIDDDGNDLTDEQQRAIIKDDTYNLVVAGAGAGKTVTLTTRIAYLSRRSDHVPPERILAISYTNNATGVMAERLDERFGIDGVETTTFHGLGKGIVSELRSEAPAVFTDGDRKTFIKRVIDERTESPESPFRKRYTQFLHHFYAEYDDAQTEDSVTEAVQDITEADHLTLRQEEVNGDSERRIADFLFLNQVDYEHRAILDWVEESPGRGVYRADFYLPEYGVVIAHRPIDASKSVVDWSDASMQSIERRIEWERLRIHESTECQLVETYEFEAHSDQLERVLASRLSDAGVILDERPYEEYLESVYDYTTYRSRIMDLFSEFIINARQLNLSVEALESRLPDGPPKEFAFGQCGLMLYRAYCDHLEANGYIDFPGMLYQAIELMDEKPEDYGDRYDQILVDEFQDISMAKVELLRRFVTDTNDTTLFCVGDDWQSIYSFAGSDVTFFIDFETYFDEPARTALTKTFRCPPSVVDASNELISNNDRQLAKTVESAASADTTITAHELPMAPSSWDYREALFATTIELIQQYLDQGADPCEILVLCRTNYLLQHLAGHCADHDIKATVDPTALGWGDNPDEHVRLLSVHKAKGDEANHVIIVHAVEDHYGFPIQVQGDDLLDPVQIEPDDRVAEERRLFYVALTRTKQTLDIITSESHPSRFLAEIDHHLEVEPITRSDTDEPTRTAFEGAWLETEYDPPDKQAQSGILNTGGQTFSFLMWESSGHQPLEAGTKYRLDSAKVVYNDYRDEREVHIDEQTTVEPVGTVEST